MKNFILTILLFISNILSSQYIEGLSLTQNGTDQIKAHLQIYFPTDGAYISYTKDINQNIITLNVCYYKNELGGSTAVNHYENDFYIDIPNNNNYTLNINLYSSWNETTCTYNVLEDTVTLNFTTPINGTISLAAIESQNKNHNLVLFPNPTKGIFNIKTNQKIEKAKIYDISGKIIQNLFPLNSKIDVSKLEDGIYFIEILSDGKIQRKKFVLKK